MAIEAWNLAGGGEWAALPFVVEALGIDDVGGLLHRWSVIRAGLNKAE